MQIDLISTARIRLNVTMKTTQKNDELDQVITNDVVKDVETGDVLFEEITCETSTRLPKLELVAGNDDYVGHTCEGFIAPRPCSAS